MLEDREATVPTRESSAPRRASVAASLFVPAAAVSIIELGAAVVTASGVDRPYAARASALAALTLMTVAGAAGLALGRAGLVRSARAAVSMAAGLSVFLSLLFVLANGLPPLSDRFEPSRALAIALVAGLLAATARALPRGARAYPLAVWIEPPLIAGAIAGGYALLRVFRMAPASGTGLGLWIVLAALALAGGVALHLVTRRLYGRRGPGSAPIAMLAAAALCPLLALIGLGAGRSPFATPADAASSPPRAERRDVLVIVMDTTRADFVPAPPESRSPTPALTGLAREGARWTNAFSTSCWTLPAHGSLFTGLAPSEHGATWATEHLPPGVPTLAERFRRAGWRTAAFSANPWITPEFGFDRGFDRFAVGEADRRALRPWLLALTDRGPWSAAAPLFEDAGGLALASEALRFLDAREESRPAFVFLNLLEPHLPYDPPRAALGSLEGSGWTRRELDAIDQDRLADLSARHARSTREIEGLRLLYAAEVAYDDMLVGRIVSGLKRAGRLDATVIAITSDHGENLGDHPPLDHQLGLWDSLLRVPLIVRDPARLPAGTTETGLVSLVDLPGALLALAGAPDASALDAGAGGPLLGAKERDAVFFEYDRSSHLLGLIRDRLGIDAAPWDRDLAGIRTRTHKWIAATNGRNEAYDLDADPGERSNLAAERAGGDSAPAAPPFDAISARLRDAMAARAPRPAKETSPPMSEESAEKLRSLGYVR